MVPVGVVSHSQTRRQTSFGRLTSPISVEDLVGNAAFVVFEDSLGSSRQFSVDNVKHDGR